MIGVFDSGHGGLTILEALVRRFPGQSFTYLGDHANAPYGDRPTGEIIDLTRSNVERLFRAGSRLVILACNTATAAAARPLQQRWLPGSGWDGHNLLGIVAPTVEAATQTPWGITTPQYPQKFTTDLVAVFGTVRTIASGVYPDEIRKRTPQVTVIQQAVPGLAAAIEQGASPDRMDEMVGAAVGNALATAGGVAPDRAILGCTHFPLVGDLFRAHLPPTTRVLSQPTAVADSLDDYLARHPEYASDGGAVSMLTTAAPNRMIGPARRFWPEVPPFVRVG
jgi:glutamate racemase